MIAEQAPDLHDVLERGRREGWSHVSLDATLIEIDRVAARKENGHHLCTRASTSPTAAMCRSSRTHPGSPSGPARGRAAAGVALIDDLARVAH